MKTINKTDSKRGKSILSIHGQNRLLFYAQLLDEIAGYYTCKDTKLCMYKDKQTFFHDQVVVENERMMKNQLMDLSCVLKQMAMETYVSDYSIEKHRKQLINGLEENELNVEEVYAFCYPKGRLEIGVNCFAKPGDYYSVDEMATFVSSVFRRKMNPDKECMAYIFEEPMLVVFREELNYQLSHYVARATKQDESISGDNYIVQNYPDGRSLIAISDGMGSGEKAKEDSELVVELYDKLLEAGMKMTDAAREVNDVLCMRTKSLRTATLDSCVLDLCSGTVSLLKAAASPTYIKNNDKVEKIVSNTLPFGIIQGEQGENFYQVIEENTQLILVTDGVYDAFFNKGKDMLKEYIQSLHEKTPKQIANKILQMAIGLSQGEIRDDMTVFVCILGSK